jgi:hypothetical protein
MTRLWNPTGFAAGDGTSGIASPCTAGPGAVCPFTQSTATEGSAVTIASGPVTDGAGNRTLQD